MREQKEGGGKKKKREGQWFNRLACVVRITQANLNMHSCSYARQSVLMNKLSPIGSTEGITSWDLCAHARVCPFPICEQESREKARQREKEVTAWPHRSIEMIFSHKSDEAVSARVCKWDRYWVIQLWEYTGSDLSWKARETNRFHSPRSVWLLSPVVLNAKKIPVSSQPLTPSHPHPQAPTLFSYPLPSLHSPPLRMINTPCPVWVPVVALTRLLFYHRESDVAEIHGHLDTLHKSCKAEVGWEENRACCVTCQERIAAQKPYLF